MADPEASAPGPAKRPRLPGAVAAGAASASAAVSPLAALLGGSAQGGSAAAPQGRTVGGGGGGRGRDVQVLQEAEARRRAAAAAAAAKEDRLRCAATSFSLWRRPENDSFAEAPASYPGGVDAYIGTLEPLLFEEAREEVRAEWGAACEEGALHAVTIQNLRPESDGWHVASLAPASQTARFLSTRGVLADGAVAVLSSGPPGQDPWRDFKSAAASEDGARRAREAAAKLEDGEVAPAASTTARRPGAAALVHVAGFVVRVQALRRDEPPALYLRFHIPQDEAPEHRTLFFQPSDLLAAMRESRSKIWYIATCGKLSSSLAEFRALHNIRHLHPPLRDALLDPAGCGVPLPRYGDDTPPALAHELNAPGFVAHLTNRFNEPQRCAIQWAAAAVASVPSEQASCDASSISSWPFTLIQGPPGTGKTQTVWGVLNVLHLVAFQRYYQCLLAALAPRGAAVSQANAAAKAAIAAEQQRRAMYGDELDDEDGGNSSDALTAALASLDGGGMTRTLASLSAKPRILVCAPSNAAVDVLLQRCMDNGFVQKDGGVYRPDVVRLSAEDAVMNDRVREVTVAFKMEQLLRMSHAERQHHLAALQHHAHATEARIHELRAICDAAAMPHRSGAVHLEPGKLDELLRELVRLNEQLDRMLVDAARLQVISEGDRQQGAGNGVSLKVRGVLEASFVNEAELVFTTLASAGRSVFSRLEHGFDLVLIDEAAQASEVAALVPLRYGAKAAVLVGDPQQLPATVLSAAARAGLYTRSLFERLTQCGASAALLSVQYRMHPAIRSWPSRFFYSSKLTDAPSVIAMPDEPFYVAGGGHLQPYRVFDVSSGRDQRAQGAGGSVRNLAEAALAAALYAKLRASLPAGAASGRCGVVTPYRRQKQALRDAFVRRMGEEVLKEVTIDTVDSFQGQEKDVIILSLVRAAELPPAAKQQGGTGGDLIRNTLGFVNDVRRMNVALTRAKRALWVLGHADSLRQSPQWADFLQDAEERGVLVPNASAATIFPEETGRPQWDGHLGGQIGPSSTARQDTTGLGYNSRAAAVAAPPQPQLVEVHEGGMFTTTSGAPLHGTPDDVPAGGAWTTTAGLATQAHRAPIQYEPI